MVECRGLDTTDPAACGLWIDDEVAPFVALSSKRVLAVVPESSRRRRSYGSDSLSQRTPDVEISPNDLAVSVQLESHGERSPSARFIVGRRLAEDLHPVTNPAFNPDDGSLFVTRSGSRGEQLPVSVFRIDVNGDVTDFSGDIANPTAIAFNKEGEMFVSSRFDGTVYRVTPFKDAQPFARNLGVATGIAFDPAGTMYVGDRTGTIFTVNEIGEEQSWAELEPSVSAYHLAWGPDAALYVTGPTVTSFDSIYRIDEDGDVAVFFRGLGRPQGLAFDTDGNLYVAATLRGRRGIVRISPGGDEAELVVTGMNLVGLAFSHEAEMIVASNDSVYSVPVGIRGTLTR